MSAEESRVTMVRLLGVVLGFVVVLEPEPITDSESRGGSQLRTVLEMRHSWCPSQSNGFIDQLHSPLQCQMVSDQKANKSKSAERIRSGSPASRIGQS